MPIRVAYDMTPTLGMRTGIGNVVAHLFDEIESNSEVDLKPYTLSYKARSYKSDLPKTNIFISVPARILLLSWKFSKNFSLDSQLGEIDLWHATNYLAPPTKYKQLITIHDLTMLKYPELVTSKVRALAPVIKKRLEAGAHVHVPSEAIAKDVEKHFSEVIDKHRIHISPFAVPELIEGRPSQNITSLVNGDPYLLSIGSLDPRKNHARIIEAFGIVNEQFPHMRLFIVGPDGPARPDIDRAMANLNQQSRSRVFITGSVSDIDRTYLLKKAHLLVYPSLYEGFGLPLLEAMATNTPIITSKEGSLEEIADKSAVFVDALNVEDIAKGINEVLGSTEIQDKLISLGKEHLKKFSWQSSANKLIDIYKSVIEETN